MKKTVFSDWCMELFFFFAQTFVSEQQCNTHKTHLIANTMSHSHPESSPLVQLSEWREGHRKKRGDGDKIQIRKQGNHGQKKFYCASYFWCLMALKTLIFMFIFLPWAMESHMNIQFSAKQKTVILEQFWLFHIFLYLYFVFYVCSSSILWYSTQVSNKQLTPLSLMRLNEHRFKKWRLFSLPSIYTERHKRTFGIMECKSENIFNDPVC